MADELGDFGYKVCGGRAVDRHLTPVFQADVGQKPLVPLYQSCRDEFWERNKKRHSADWGGTNSSFQLISRPFSTCLKAWLAASSASESRDSKTNSKCQTPSLSVG